MSTPIIQLNEESVKSELKELVRHSVELSMIGDTTNARYCQGGDCKVFVLRKVYNTTLTKQK